MARPKEKIESPVPLKMAQSQGINNVLPAEKCKPNELQTASNVDINVARQLIGRQGRSKIYTGSSPHSLFSNGRNGSATIRLFREGSTLYKLNSNNIAIPLRGGLTRRNWMKYLALNDLIYYTDEHVTGITNGVTDRTWGLVPPPQQLTLTAITGNLPSGRYLCTLTYVREDGQESGAPNPVYIDLATSNAGIRISNIPSSSDSGVTRIHLYLSTRNGEVLYRAAIVNNGSAPYSYQGNAREFSRQLTTLSLDRPHAGHLIAFYNGRIYIAKDDTIWYTLPYNYELMDRAHGYIHFPSRVTLLAPVQGGIWVSCMNHKTQFLAGEDPEKGFVSTRETEYWAHEGSQQEDEIVLKGEEVVNGWYWTTSNGVYMGLDEGVLLNKTENRYRPGSASVAVSFIKKTQDGSKQYLSVLY